jgi:hypothetical protein
MLSLYELELPLSVEDFWCEPAAGWLVAAALVACLGLA